MRNKNISLEAFHVANKIIYWGPTKRISKRNSTNNASWGGPQHREIGTPISTGNASWGGPQHKEILFL
ncbi:hypothetical protein [Staphylococcus aureus]|uniref:hypothetical protein n=1 Tax=Staphylococcus aureus TaxID=1280 RepID=UPI0014435489|nr:hypothetical protein [Staphylococcus aureus]NKO26762.1 hypothetical protein [Staphylococcus aureus]NKP59069.1 hypothetical protein [Staphylococcus aureus]